MPDLVKVTRLLAAVLVVASFSTTGSQLLGASRAPVKLDPELQKRVGTGTGMSRVIIRLASRAPRGAAQALLHQHGGTTGRSLSIINSHVGFLPNQALAALAASPLVERISTDRLAVGTTERTAAAIGAAPLRQALGLDGTGIGVAILDSGITPWHDDLTGAPEASQRVDRFVDFVGARGTAYDDYGHGTHVAGIVAGNGLNSGGARAGIAPGARLTVLKVLDSTGRGYISDVIAALDYVVTNKYRLNIRIINLSLAAPAYETYDQDPLTRAAKEAVDAGLVVIAAAGNAGRNANGATVYRAVGAPGNAPWVLTVGASSHAGTVERADDSIAAFSSRGPGRAGNAAKPDVVAPGVGIVSLSDRDSALYSIRAAFLLDGTVPTSYQPYLSLSGTSMAAPVVSGTVALMLQANPALTPNQVKAILQYTAQVYPGYDPLTQGAGFLNAQGAIELARYFSDPLGQPYPSDPRWGRRVIWGNRLVAGGRLEPHANAWSSSVTWGEATENGEPIAWGVREWTAADGTAATTEGPWDLSSESVNVVWGMECGGEDCEARWNGQGVSANFFADETVVWGMDDTVVWGMDAGDETVVWGMTCASTLCEPVIWSDR